MNYEEAIEFIFGRLNYERAPGLAKSLNDFKLTRMQRLLKKLGDPQLQVPTIHIAGSKGKGSTATMVARILETAGLRVGLFTSPHVIHYEERFTVNNQRPSDAQIVAYVNRIRPIIEQMDRDPKHRGPTFFEISTAIGWLHFLEEKTDVAVIEVGLGGRLDSTNVCQPLVTAITSISLDHTHLLGDTVEKIAREKAGIIKSGTPVVSGVTASGPANVIRDIATEQLAELFEIGRDFDVLTRESTPAPFREPPRYEFDYTSKNSSPGPLKNVHLKMPGMHQVTNAALAINIVSHLGKHGYKITEDDIRRGLLLAKCPLRIEVISRDPLLIIDAAHNPASIKALCVTLREVQATRRIALLAFSKDKDVPELMRLLNDHFDEFYLTRYQNPRSLDIPQLKGNAEACFTKPWQCIESPQIALQELQAKASQTDLICVTGSFFLAAEIEDYLKPVVNTEV